METSQTVVASGWESLASYVDAMRTAYATGGFSALMEDYSAALAVVAIAALVLVLLVTVLLMPSRRKIVRRRVVRVSQRRVAPVTVPAESEGPEPSDEDAGAPGRVSPRELARRWGVTVVCLLILLAGFVASYVITGSNGYCGQSCHFEQPAVVLALENPHADCVDCHESGIVSGGFARLRMAYEYTRSENTTGVVSEPVSPARCLRCHRDIARDTVTTSTGVRVSHAEMLASGRACSDCHQDVGHRERRSFAGGMARCTVCHDGTTASSECAQCHPDGSPLAEPLTINDPGSSFQYPTVQAANRECERCHVDQEACIACHNGFQLPHSTEFREGGHGRLAAFNRRERCYKCHTIYWCGDGTCHNAFTPHDPERWLLEHQTGTSEKCGGCHIAWDHQGNWCDVCH